MIESKFLTPLRGEWLGDDVTFMLTDNFRYQSAILGGILTMPKGYCTDFSSVPKVPFVYEAFGNRAHHESVPHDFLYQKHDVVIEQQDGPGFILHITRSMADSVFKEAMIVRQKPAWIRNGMYAGVRLGGWNSYRTGPKRFKILNPQTTLGPEFSASDPSVPPSVK